MQGVCKIPRRFIATLQWRRAHPLYVSMDLKRSFVAMHERMQQHVEVENAPSFDKKDATTTTARKWMDLIRESSNATQVIGLGELWLVCRDMGTKVERKRAFIEHLALWIANSPWEKRSEAIEELISGTVYSTNGFHFGPDIVSLLSKTVAVLRETNRASESGDIAMLLLLALKRKKFHRACDDLLDYLKLRGEEFSQADYSEWRFKEALITLCPNKAALTGQGSKGDESTATASLESTKRHSFYVKKLTETFFQLVSGPSLKRTLLREVFLQVLLQKGYFSEVLEFGNRIRYHHTLQQQQQQQLSNDAHRHQWFVGNRCFNAMIAAQGQLSTQDGKRSQLLRELRSEKQEFLALVHQYQLSRPAQGQSLDDIYQFSLYDEFQDSTAPESEKPSSTLKVSFGPNKFTYISIFHQQQLQWTSPQARGQQSHKKKYISVERAKAQTRECRLFLHEMLRDKIEIDARLLVNISSVARDANDFQLVMMLIEIANKCSANAMRANDSFGSEYWQPSVQQSTKSSQPQPVGLDQKPDSRKGGEIAELKSKVTQRLLVDPVSMATLYSNAVDIAGVSRKSRECLHLFSVMLHLQLPVTADLAKRMMEYMIRCEQYDDCHRIFAYLPTWGIERNKHHIGSLIKALLKEGKLRESSAIIKSCEDQNHPVGLRRYRSMFHRVRLLLTGKGRRVDISDPPLTKTELRDICVKYMVWMAHSVENKLAFEAGASFPAKKTETGEDDNDYSDDEDDESDDSNKNEVPRGMNFIRQELFPLVRDCRQFNIAGAGQKEEVDRIHSGTMLNLEELEILLQSMEDAGPQSLKDAVRAARENCIPQP